MAHTSDSARRPFAVTSSTAGATRIHSAVLARLRHLPLPGLGSRAILRILAALALVATVSDALAYSNSPSFITN